MMIRIVRNILQTVMNFEEQCEPRQINISHPVSVFIEKRIIIHRFTGLLG